MRTIKVKGTILKIDLSKAFDRVSWSYIMLLLTHLEFEVPFIKWIMDYISSVSFTVLINGATSPFFTCEKGIHQGCPLSPLLFLLVAEGLSRAIENVVSSGYFHGIQLTTRLRITHLLFVDAILIFCSGRRRHAKVLSNILSLFHSTTGMQINIQKYTLSFSEMESEDEEIYRRLFPYTFQEFSEGLKYLGFNLKPNNYLKKDWKWLISKLEKRLSGWSFRWLSRERRLNLNKEVLEATSFYWMSLSWIPKETLENIRKVCSHFIWSGTRDKITQPWEKRDHLAWPKALGGWGLKKYFCFPRLW
jgi:hypothetical protein